MDEKIKTLHIEGDIVHVKKKGKHWDVVYPIRQEDGSINWFNLLTGGRWGRFIFNIVLLIFIVLAILEYKSNMEVCRIAIEQMNQMNSLLR